MEYSGPKVMSNSDVRRYLNEHLVGELSVTSLSDICVHVALHGAGGMSEHIRSSVLFANFVSDFGDILPVPLPNIVPIHSRSFRRHHHRQTSRLGPSPS